MATATLYDSDGEVGVVLPIEVRQRFGLKAGQRVTLIEMSDGLKLVPYNPLLERQIALAAQIVDEHAETLRLLNNWMSRTASCPMP